MLRKIHGTNFFHMKLLDHTNIKCQNRPVLPPALVFYFNCQALNGNATAASVQRELIPTGTRRMKMNMCVINIVIIKIYVNK
jgi:hypothetical protein